VDYAKSVLSVRVGYEDPEATDCFAIEVVQYIFKQLACLDGGSGDPPPMVYTPQHGFLPFAVSERVVHWVLEELHIVRWCVACRHISEARALRMRSLRYSYSDQGGTGN
jgi:hypothetical protein